MIYEMKLSFESNQIMSYNRMHRKTEICALLTRRRPQQSEYEPTRHLLPPSSLWVVGVVVVVVVVGSIAIPNLFGGAIS